MAITSAPVLPSDPARATHYNTLRTDFLTHTHDGADTPGLSLANNQYLQGADNGGTKQNLIGIDTANVVQLGGGQATRSAGPLTAAGGLTVPAGGASVTGGLTVVSGGFVVQGGGCNVTGAATFNGTINGQTISATASFTGSVGVSGTFSALGGASVSTGLTVVNGGFVVQAGGCNVTGTAVFNSAATFGSTINGQTVSAAASFTGTLAVAGAVNGQTIGAAAVFTGTLAVGASAAQSGTLRLPYAGTLVGRNNLNNGDTVLLLSVGSGVRLAGTVNVDTAGIFPYAPNAVPCGLSGTPWSVVYAQNGTIQPSSRAVKDDIADLDPARALGIARATRVKTFRYTGSDLVQAGFIAEDTDPLLTLDGKSASPQTTACLALGAIQELDRRLSALEARA